VVFIGSGCASYVLQLLRCPGSKESREEKSDTLLSPLEIAAKTREIRKSPLYIKTIVEMGSLFHLQPGLMFGDHNTYKDVKDGLTCPTSESSPCTVGPADPRC
jgi:hypothetical protein